jgi:Fe2+ transport system protein FeoA
MRMPLKIDSLLLRDLPVGKTGRIASIQLPDDERHWVDALGLSVGRGVTLLRRAPLNGPLHLRLDTGTEFALGVDLAALMHLENLS